MVLIFCGTPRFAVPTLEKLVEAGHAVPLVVTQPDKPRGRGMVVTVSPVKEAARRLGLPITQPDKIKSNDDFREQLAAIHPDAIIVVGYGRIIPQWMIDLPRLGNLNLHASLLPKYRGAAPIQWAIANGESVTGVTTMRIDAGLDTGDILLQRELPIGPDDTAETLGPKLAAVGADLMVDTLPKLETGQTAPRPQDHTKATIAPILKKEDGRIDFSINAVRIYNRLRGFQPWPGAYTTYRGRNIAVLTAAVHLENKPLFTLDEDLAVSDGAIIVVADRIFVYCHGDTWLELLEVRPEGKRRMSVREFINGYRPKTGDHLGQ
jgi:methionyl-tRNA formyltransferase